MNITKIVDLTLSGYLANILSKDIYDENADDFKLLFEQIAAGEDLQNRKNMRGHVTSSFMLLNKEKTKVLMIYHNRLQKWLPPGGHYEGYNSLVVSALRELNEETGWPVEMVEGFDRTGYVLVDVDSHSIPANPAKDEGEHVHHDFLYLGIATGEHDLIPQFEEVSAVKWVDLDSLRYSLDHRVVRCTNKVIQLLAQELVTKL